MHTIPSDWDETDYLQRHPDVAEAVRAGEFLSGHEHYLRHGESEQRPRSRKRPQRTVRIASDQAARLTRQCHDPWVNLEISASGDVRPCCIATPMPGQDVRTIQRDAPAFRELRAALLSGDLPPMCRSCHIRETTTVGELHDSLFLEADDQHDVLAPLPLKTLRVDVNEQCNLRCTYCAVSQPGYQGVPMAAEVFDAVLALIDNDPVQQIDLNGHGETTFHPGWMEFVLQIQKRPALTTILSNFARLFSEAEAATLARMWAIQISMDSADTPFLKAIRRKVSLATIRRNMALVRAKAKAMDLQPLWSISCGVYDLNIDHLDGLADFAIENGFNGVTFWKLVEYPPVAEGPHARPLDALEPAARQAAYEVVDGVVKRLQGAGLQVSVPQALRSGE